MNGFRKKTYNKKPKLLKIAIKVDNQAKNYNLDKETLNQAINVLESLENSKKSKS